MMNRNILHPMMFETPTPTWEWIYHSTELWLISLSVDGTTWYTIADKNLWASSLWWNWLYYQRWNNYWFGSWNYVRQQRVDATNYWPYYNRWVFVAWGIVPWTADPIDWSNPHNDNLWWWLTNRIEDKQWPCPDWFHIPTYDEFHALYDKMHAMTWNPQTQTYKSTETQFVQCLMMPLTWAISYTYDEESDSYTWWWNYVAEQWPYRSSTWAGARAHIYVCWGLIIDYEPITGKTTWAPIRPFKNTIVVPDETWVVMYDRSDIAPRAGIYWNAEDWIITISSDWVNFQTLADKNIWATQIYQDWVSQYTQDTCGWVFQRWNNYMFPYLWDPTSKDHVQVDASNYGPYYYSSDFIGTTTNYTYNWSSVTNKNLWWWVTNTDIAKRWPCPEWFHIPTMLEESEFERNLWILWGSIGTIYMPNTWLMYPNMSVYDKTFRWVWTSQRAEGGDTPYFRWNFYRSYWAWRWMQIRPFKNTPVVPDSTWTKLY